MAKRIITTVTDDIDGSEDDVRSVRINVPFEIPVSKYGPGNPSTIYEIDLSKANRDKLRKALEPFVKNARRVTGYDPDSLRPGEGNKVREWAKKQGIVVGDRGRIPVDIIRQYRAAND